MEDFPILDISPLNPLISLHFQRLLELLKARALRRTTEVIVHEFHYKFVVLSFVSPFFRVWEGFFQKIPPGYPPLFSSVPLGKPHWFLFDHSPHPVILGGYLAPLAIKILVDSVA
ncbi:hypothetical protein HCUR_00134 [Holospora curviuscula]|uniref:Uncharacterized protein n=1 Tax=Holospora curviuscula TaxID=1082868 RepID=A0A2S5RGE6_9PROT|nr:hypothetical protein HCUR_00134 [Holospora curviuscula]